MLTFHWFSRENKFSRSHGLQDGKIPAVPLHLQNTRHGARNSAQKAGIIEIVTAQLSDPPPSPFGRPTPTTSILVANKACRGSLRNISPCAPLIFPMRSLVEPAVIEAPTTIQIYKRFCVCGRSWFW